VGAFLLRLVPKVGPLRILIPKPPPPEGERIYEESFNVVLADYRAAVPAGRPPAANVNLDVGTETPPGAYPRADAAWGDLCARLAAAGAAAAVDPALASAILARYEGLAIAAAPPSFPPLRERLERARTRGE
jgi:hypothetical protein